MHIKKILLVLFLFPISLIAQTKYFPAHLSHPTNTLIRSDFTLVDYLDTSQTDFAESIGLTTSRTYTDGNGTNTFRLLIIGNMVSNPGSRSIYEVSSTNGTTLNHWGDVFCGIPYDQLIFDAANGNPNNAYPVISGIGYIGNAKGNVRELLSFYTSNYNVVPGDPGVMRTILNDDGSTTCSGPYNTSVGPQNINGQAFVVPSSFITATGVNKPIGVTSTVRGGQSSGDRGANILMFDLPAWGTTADPPSNGGASLPGTCTNGQHFFLTSGTNGLYTCGSSNNWTFTSAPTINNPTAAVFFDVQHAQARNTNYFIEVGRWDGGDNCNGGNPSHHVGQPVFGDNPSQVTIDAVTDGVWIESGTKKGWIQVGHIGDTTFQDSNNWYGGYSGSNTDCLGLGPGYAQGATGPQSTSLVHWIWFWNPDDFVNIAKGLAQPYSPTTIDEARTMTALNGLGDLIVSLGRFSPDQVRNYYEMHCTYDPASHTFYLVQQHVFKQGCCNFTPRIYKFTVAQ